MEAEEERRRKKRRSRPSGETAKGLRKEKKRTIKQRNRNDVSAIDKAALMERRDDIKLDPKEFGFEETFVVNSGTLPEDVVDPDNDLLREVAFYNQALTL